MTRRSPAPRGHFWLLLVLLTPIGLFFLPSTLLLLAGMVPTLVAYAVDRDAEKSAALTVGSMNLCGVAPFIVMLWQDGHHLDNSIYLLSRPATWMVMFAAAGVGWLLYAAIPQIFAGMSAGRTVLRIQALEQQRSVLVAEWGPEIIGGPAAGAEPAGLMGASGKGTG